MWEWDEMVCEICGAAAASVFDDMAGGAPVGACETHRAVVLSLAMMG